MTPMGRGALPPGLTARHVLVLVGVYVDGLTHEAVGERIGRSRQRVGQLVAEALRILDRAGWPAPVRTPGTRGRTRSYDVRVLARYY